MSKRNIIIILAVLLILTNAIQVFVWMNNRKQLIAGYEAQIADYQTKLSAYKPDETVYTVASPVIAGQEITKDCLQTMSLSGTYDSDMYVKDPSTIIGKYFKIAIKPGAMITTNEVMDYKLTQDMRDYDLVLTAYTVGLQKGDYIDVYFTAPYGDRYIVLSKVRIESINGSTLKTYLTDAQRHEFSGALTDYYLNAAYGATLTAEKYVEPGLQTASVPYYAVPDNISALMESDPNIVDKATVMAASSWRASIDQLLQIFRDEDDTVDTDGSTLAAGRADYFGKINDANSDLEQDKEQAAQNGDASIDGTTSTDATTATDGTATSDTTATTSSTDTTSGTDQMWSDTTTDTSTATGGN